MDFGLARLLRPWGFSRQEHWSGLPCSPPGDLPHPGMEPRSPVLAGGFSTTESPGKPPLAHLLHTGVLLLTSFFGGASQVVLVVKTLPADAGDMTDAGSIPGWGRSPGGGNGNPLQCACLGESQGQRSLAEYGPRGRRESDRTEAPQHSCASFCRMRNRGTCRWRSWLWSAQV